MIDQYSRTIKLLGKDAMTKLFNAKVVVFGIGGVGGYCTEALARSGIGRIDLVDHDKVCASNINRQLHATIKTVGRYKVDVAEERILDINPDATINKFKIFYLPDTSRQIDLSLYDYVIDAIDTVSGKIELITQASASSTPIISSMGAGNKMNITDFEVADIFDTSVCPLAKVLRRELRERGIKNLKVVYSKESPINCINNPQSSDTNPESGSLRKNPPGSNAFVPAAVGLIIAGEVVKDLIR